MLVFTGIMDVVLVFIGIFGMLVEDIVGEVLDTFV